PNHFHFILKQLSTNGISNYLHRLTDSFARYFNVKTKNTGGLFESNFKSVYVEDDSQLIHLSRYIHLNPVTGFLVNKPEEYRYSSYNSYIDIADNLNQFVKPNIVLDQFTSRSDYQKFVNDRIDYQRELKRIEHLALE
ncbi:transposase, partial [Candidatus Microgenomates bacterium]|nr:transposase [Candidatus Microgenomates bacterium]